MTSIGDTLRKERFRRGWTLERVAFEIKIRPRLLEAIEEDAFSRLPCPMLARSFVRQYARAMCVDEQEAVAQVNQRLAEAGIPTSLPEFKDRSSGIPLFPQFADIREWLRTESSLAALLWLTLASFFCATVYTTWLHRSQGGAIATALHAAMPDIVERGSAARQVATPSASETIAPALQLAAQDKLETAAPTHPTLSPIRALFTATEPVWISVRSDATPIYTGTLQAQESRQFEGADKILVTVGNAGGVIVTLNDKPVGPLGHAGEVRQLELTPSGAFLNKSPRD